MLNTSLRRVARTYPNAAISSRCNTQAGGSIPTATFSTRCHQRRYSSSKPPTPPNNGSPSIPATSVKQVGAPRSSDKRAGAESRLSKRKAVKGDKAEVGKQVQELKGSEWTLQLPSVPSTQHLNPKDVYVASFFSTHRPISISGPLPPETQIDDFEKIFQAKPKRARHGAAEVLYTLSSTVQNLDENIQRGQQQGPQHNEQHIYEQRVGLIKALTQQNAAVGDGNQITHLDGQSERGQGNVKLMIQELARRFRPFHTPPPPVPAPEVELFGRDGDFETATNGESQAKSLELETEQQDGQTMVSHLDHINQSKDLHSREFFTSRAIISDPTSTAEITDPSRQPSKGGRLQRGMYMDPTRHIRSGRYYAISVKRQRRLKMKKHKYKKLMRKTRNLRRRQDKL